MTRYYCTPVIAVNGCGVGQAWLKIRLRSKVYVSELYFAMQLPYEVQTSSPYVPMVCIANAVRVRLSNKCGLYPSYVCLSSCSLIGCGSGPRGRRVERACHIAFYSYGPVTPERQRKQYRSQNRGKMGTESNCQRRREQNRFRFCVRFRSGVIRPLHND